MVRYPATPANARMDVRKRVGVNLQRLRRQKALSQEELAHRSDVHQTYLSGVEGGKRNPSIGVLRTDYEGTGRRY